MMASRRLEMAIPCTAPWLGRPCNSELAAVDFCRSAAEAALAVQDLLEGSLGCPGRRRGIEGHPARRRRARGRTLMGRFWTLRLPRPMSRRLALAVLVWLLTQGHAITTGDSGLDRGDQQALRRYARDTWHSFEAMAQAGALPADGLRRDEDGTWRPTEQTTPTDIGAYLWSTLAAERLGIIEPAEARRRLEQTLAALAGVERPHGLFLDKLDRRSGARLRAWPEIGRASW